jgi:ribosomal protein L37AE/L43A
MLYFSMISLRCLVCGKQITYVRIKTGAGVCITCGAILPADQVKSQREAQIQAIKAQDNK